MTDFQKSLGRKEFKHVVMPAMHQSIILE
jgi:hypothetical protein